MLTLAGNLTPYGATLPTAGFECGCICDTVTLSRLGTVAVALRAIDRGPNFQDLESECAAGVPLQVIDGVLQRPCSSAIRPGVLVRGRSRCCLQARGGRATVF